MIGILLNLLPFQQQASDELGVCGTGWSGVGVMGIDGAGDEALGEVLVGSWWLLESLGKHTNQ